MSNLISNNQRSTAQEPEVEQPPIPKPPRKLQDSDPSNQLSGLEVASQTDAPDTLAVGESIEFVAPQQESVVGLTDYFGDKLGSDGVQVQIPQAPAASTPPMINLWKDATVDLGIPNLADQRLVTTASPRPYADPLTYGNQFGSTETFVQGAAANARADAQEQANRTAAIAKAAQDFQNARGNLPNTPDASKPWHEQLWGWAGDVLQGTERERAEENRTGKGTFGAYGSGLGGFFKSVFGVPIAAATATYLETWGRDEYNMQRRLLRAGNPTVRTERITADGKRMSVEAPFNSLSDEEKHKYLTEVVSNRLPLGTGALVRTNVDFRKAFGTYIYDAFAGNVNDSINEANPKLAPVIDRRTGKPAVAKPARGLLQSANLRPGQEWYEDGGGTALEIATQLFSPGNKVDAAGELLGLGFKLLARTNAAKTTGRAVVNAIPKPVKQAASAVASAGGRTVQGIKQGNFGSKPTVAPISQPTRVVGLPQNRGTAFEAYLRQPPVVPNVPAFEPQRTPFAPKTDPEGLAAVVGIGQKGQPLSFTPSVGLRTHQELVEQVLKQNPERFGTYKGTTWADWEQWKATNLGEEDLRQLEAVGAELMPPRVQMEATRESSLGNTTTNELNPPRVKQSARLQGGELAPVTDDTSELAPPRIQMTATLDDLQAQQRTLVEQKLSIEGSLKQLEETFDELVDVGRREIDELPMRTLAEADVQKAIDYGAGVRLSRALPPSVVEAAAKGQWEQVQAQAQALGGMQALLESHNRALQDLGSVVQVPATTNLTKALPPVVYHGTALQQWQAYNLTEFGSRGELGSALYTTALYDEAVAYAQATVGNNRSVEIAYEPLSPQVLAFDTSKLQATLDARLSLDDSSLLEDVLWRADIPTKDFSDYFVRNQGFGKPDNYSFDSLDWSSNISFAEASQMLETYAARMGGSEEILQKVSNSVSDVLRERGYDSVYDPNSGWLAVIDNGKLDVVKQESFSPPSAVQAAVARYNADSLAAGAYPTHLTSDANLRDSTFQLLDTARNQLDERLEEVQQQLAEATSKEAPEPLALKAAVQSFDSLRARAKEPPSVERYVRDIQEFGQPLHPVILEELPLNPRTGNPEFIVVGNADAYSAAVQSYHPRDYSMVAAMVKGTKERVAGMSAGENYYLVDIRAIKGKGATNVAPASTKAEVLKEFNSKNPGFTTAPVVLEQTSFDTFRVLDRGYTANAYQQLYKSGERGAEMVPAMVIDKSGKVDFFLVDLSSIEKKAKALEPEVPKENAGIVEQMVVEQPKGKPSLPDSRNQKNISKYKDGSFKRKIDDANDLAREAAIHERLKGTGLTPDFKVQKDSLRLKDGGVRVNTLLSSQPELLEKARLRLQELHALGITHGDANVDNILLGSDGNLRFIDFEFGKLEPTADDFYNDMRFFENSFRQAMESRGLNYDASKALFSTVDAAALVKKTKPASSLVFSKITDDEALKLVGAIDEEGVEALYRKGNVLAHVDYQDAVDETLEGLPKSKIPKHTLFVGSDSDLVESFGYVGDTFVYKLETSIFGEQEEFLKAVNATNAIGKAGVASKDTFVKRLQSLFERLKQMLGLGRAPNYKTPDKLAPFFTNGKAQEMFAEGAEEFNSAFGRVLVGSKNRSKAQKAIARVTKLLEKEGIILPQVRGIVFFDNSTNLKSIVPDDSFIKQYGGFYLTDGDVLLVSAKGSTDSLLLHELTHAFEYKLSQPTQDKLREFVDFSLENNYRPSSYGMEDRAEFMAESVMAALLPTSRSSFPNATIKQQLLDNMRAVREFDGKAFDEMTVAEEQARWESFSDPVQPNPHKDLREALDSTIDDSPNICKF